jgi:hypothetical protein
MNTVNRVQLGDPIIDNRCNRCPTPTIFGDSDPGPAVSHRVLILGPRFVIALPCQ